MKKNKTMRAASFLLVLTLMTSCFVGSTFAKYTSTETANDTARVAKWSFDVNGKNIATETFEFDLFKTVADNHLVGSETDLAAIDGSIIAPGTSGSIALVLKNTSEVTARYAIDFTASTPAIPVEYSIDGTNWYKDINYIDIPADPATNLSINGTKTVDVYWQWPFEDSIVTSKTDSTDTDLGKAAVSADQPLTITATITAEQVD